MSGIRPLAQIRCVSLRNGHKSADTRIVQESDPSRLLTVLLGTSAAVGIFDLQLRLTWASQSFLGHLPPDSSPLGRPLTDVATRGANLPFYEALEATAADGIRREVRNESRDLGRVFDNVMTRIGDSVVVESSDVTCEVQAQEQQRLARSAQEAITEHMQEVVLMIDFQRRTVLTNQQCVDAFGDFDWLRDFVASGRPFEELELGFPIADPEGKLQEAFEVGVGVMESGEPFYGVLELPTLNGPRVFQVVSNRWEHAGEVRGLIDIKTDITEAVNTQRELEVKKQELASAALVRQFAQGVAHDMGNAAQVVKGYAQLLETNPTPEVIESAAAGLNSVADRSVRLAHNISEVARIGEVTSVPVDLSALIAGHLPTLREAVGPDIEVTFESTGHPMVLANEAQLQSILDNLCENAARAMGDSGAIHICLSISGDRAILLIRDEGPGLPDELAGRLFEPFTSGSSSGSGLGLYLLREYVRSRHGDVTAISSETGTSFSIALPLLPDQD